MEKIISFLMNSMGIQDGWTFTLLVMFILFSIFVVNMDFIEKIIKKALISLYKLIDQAVCNWWNRKIQTQKYKDSIRKNNML